MANTENNVAKTAHVNDHLFDVIFNTVNELAKKNEKAAPTSLQQTDFLSKETNLPSPNHDSHAPKSPINKKNSLIHNGDTDSSDDEDNKYPEERKYNESGRNIKSLIQATQPSSLPSSSTPAQSTSWAQKAPRASPLPKKPENVLTDPIFGLGIINPLVSSTALQNYVDGREVVHFNRIKRFVSGNTNDKNWAFAGVLATKSPVRTSKKGNQFLIWTLTDLKDDIKTVALFLFAGAYSELWKTQVGTVVGVLNPNVFGQEGTKDEACLSVMDAQRVLIMGQSRDLGYCRSMKKNGEKCTSIVNKTRCEFCVFHIKKEYQNCSRRSDLQSTFSGQGLVALRNKVLGKNEVFYAGKSYMAIPAKRSHKNETKDIGRLRTLDPSQPATIPRSNPAPTRQKQAVAVNVEVTRAQRAKDLELLEKLGGEAKKHDFKGARSAGVTLEESKSAAVSVIAKLKAKTNEDKPRLGDENGFGTKNDLIMDFPMLVSSGNVDLSATISSKKVQRAKMNALKFIQRNGPLRRNDPNSTKATKRKETDVLENEAKKTRVETGVQSERFRKIMEATSKNKSLLEMHEDAEQEKYFNQLEVKEMMEEKMANTFKVECKAVRCLKCKYTNFSAAQRCKDERHPLKVYDAMKRFFKCGSCGHRTVTLDVVPLKGCNNCGSGKWEKTGMMKEKTVTVQHDLSIRGGEQTFTNSVATNANVNLLVPDDE